jgi:hypothetical protein
MNWIEIDRILYGIIAEHENQDDMLSAARSRFKWTQAQAESAVLPLLKRNSFTKDVAEKPKKRSKK